LPTAGRELSASISATGALANSARSWPKLEQESESHHDYAGHDENDRQVPDHLTNHRNAAKISPMQNAQAAAEMPISSQKSGRCGAVIAPLP
jgi:hypothetical protein